MNNEDAIKETLNYKPKTVTAQEKVSLLKNLITTSVLKVFQENKFENVKFEDSLIEKLVNTLINLLRKNTPEEELCICILKLFISLAKKKLESCNLFVKAGCPRILLQIIETSPNKKLIALALELLKLIAVSSKENLTMLSNLGKKLFLI